MGSEGFMWCVVVLLLLTLGANSRDKGGMA